MERRGELGKVKGNDYVWMPTVADDRPINFEMGQFGVSYVLSDNTHKSMPGELVRRAILTAQRSERKGFQRSQARPLQGLFYGLYGVERGGENLSNREGCELLVQGEMLVLWQ